VYSNARTAAGEQAGDITLKGIQDMVKEIERKRKERFFIGDSRSSGRGMYDMGWSSMPRKFNMTVEEEPQLDINKPKLK
jgi:hypothetical protein